MPSHRLKTFNWLVLLATALLFCAPATAQDEPAEEAPGDWQIKEWYVFTSLYTKHWDPDPDHVNNQKMLGLEATMNNNWVAGLALFDNSFGQSSQYLYVGKQWRLFGSNYFYWKLTGGLLHGYKEPYEDKIPLNQLGVAPAILPSIGVRWKWLVGEISFAGTAATTITAGIKF